MSGPRGLSHPGRWLVAMGAAARFLAPVVRDALDDRRVRGALDDTYVGGRRLYKELRGKDAMDVASRMARDEEFQQQLTAVLRSATRAVDHGIASAHRRVRRRMYLLLVAAGGVVALVGVRGRVNRGRIASTDAPAGLVNREDGRLASAESPTASH